MSINTRYTPVVDSFMLQVEGALDDGSFDTDVEFSASVERYQAYSSVMFSTFCQKDSILITALGSEGLLSALLCSGFKVIPWSDPLLKMRCQKEFECLCEKKIITSAQLNELMQNNEISPIEALRALYEMVAIKDRHLFPWHFSQESYVASQFQYLKDHLAPFLLLDDRLPQELQQALTSHDTLVFHREFISFLAVLSKRADGIEKCFYEDVIEKVSDMPSAIFVERLCFFVLTDRFYKQYTNKVIDITRTFCSSRLNHEGEGKAFVLTRVQNLYRQSQVVFLAGMTNPIVSLTRFYSLVGKSEEAFRKVNAHFHFQKHFLCNCHGSGIDNKGVHPSSFVAVNPSSSSLDRAETVAVLGCSYGTGHKQAAQTTSVVLEKMGYHPYTVDVPENVLKSSDVIAAHLTKLMGRYAPNWSVGSIFNGLITRKAFAAINMLSGNDPLSGHVPQPPQEEANLTSVRKLLHHLLLINPSMIIVNYYPDIAESIQAAKILAVPIIHTHTDVNPFELSWRVNPSFPIYSGFYECLAFEGFKHVISPHLVAEDNITVTGPVCNPIFDERYTEEEIVCLKQKWGIDSHRRVIVLSNGANGSTQCPAIIEKVAEQYQDFSKEDIPFHFMVICGRGNELLSSQIERRFFDRMPISCVCFVSIDKMKELLAMASMGGALVGKPGGLTVFECIKQGTPLIFDEIPRRKFSLSVKDNLAFVLNALAVKKGWSNILPWEAQNKEFAVSHGFAKSCSSPEAFIDILTQLQETPMQLPAHLDDSLNRRFSSEFESFITDLQSI